MNALSRIKILRSGHKEVSFFIWDGHNKDRDVESKERHLAKVLNSGEACDEKGANWYLFDKKVAEWVDRYEEQWENRGSRYNFLENGVQSEWKLQKRMNCTQFVLCTPSAAILFLITNYFPTTEKFETNQLICSIASLPIHVKVEKWIKQKMDKEIKKMDKKPR